MGSSDSLKLLNELEKSSLNSIWDTDFKYLIDHKWKSASLFFTCFAIAHLLFLIGISFYATELIENSSVRALALVFSLLFSAYEVLQIVTDGLRYFKNFWNFIDFAGYVLFFLHTIFYMAGVITLGSSTFRSLLSVAVLFLWFRAIGDLRAF